MFKWYCVTVIVLFSLLEECAAKCEVAQTCVTDLTESDCEEGYILVPNSSIFGCCPSCQPCHNCEIKGCRLPANCLPDGRYAPVQCKGDLFTGRCFCSDENGNRIFGQMWRDQASDMTCACSRRRAKLEASGRRDVSLHCTSTGDYEHLQCDDGMCWCAQPRTGQPIVSPVPQEDMKILPCYSTTNIGEQYLRRCESIVQALGTVYTEQSNHGTNFLGSSVITCDYDGSYGPFQIQSSTAYCTGRDGGIMGSWSTLATQIGSMNCNCARDTVIHFPERGMTVTEVCSANGNYQPYQNIGDVYYCVDRDGYPTTGMLETWPEDNCASFA